VAAAAYPLHPGEPHWLLRVFQALVNLGVLALVAICLLLISGRRYSNACGKNNKCAKRCAFSARPVKPQAPAGAIAAIRRPWIPPNIRASPIEPRS
jgi:hypothetical protein